MGLQFAQNLSATMPSFINRLDLLFFKEDNVSFVYAPALDITGYGLTEIEAQKSFVVALEAFLDFAQKNKTLEFELKRLGWKKEKATMTFQPPFLDEMLRKNAYLSEIIRDYNFEKSNFKFAPA